MAIRTQQDAIKRRKQISDALLRISGQGRITDEDKRNFASLEKEFRELESLANDASHASTRPPLDPIDGQSDYRSSTSAAWVDTRTGAAVRLLSPCESFRSTPSWGSSTRAEELGLGALVRAAVLGPRNENEKRALAESVAGSGGYLLPVLASETIIDYLRARTRVIEAGAQTLRLENWAVNIARLSSDLTPTWRGESAVLTESSPNFEALQFRAKSFGTYVRVSREILEDASNLDQCLTEAFGKAMALALDRGALYGSSPSESPLNTAEPLGVVAQAGVQVIPTIGPITSYQTILDAELALANANSPGSTAVIMAPSIEHSFNSLVDTLHQPLRRPPSIENLRFLSTTTIPTNEVGGSPSTSNTSSLFSGYWPSMIIGIRSELRIDKLVERWADTGQVGVLAFMRADIQLSHPQQFVRTTGVQ
jgi:HK97 family phage major capsid protein